VKNGKQVYLQCSVSVAPSSGIDLVGLSTDKITSLQLISSFRCQGPTLTQVARVLVDQGAKYAINLDGGGSSTLVVKSRVFNHPTCVDLPIQCERPVASVMCVSVSRREADWHAID
jgi:exopolysaccharide biosynthesis protein